MDRASCCVWSSIGPYRTCKPLGSLLAQCNARSHQYPYIGSREGYSCPCGGELECFTEPERRGERRRGRCAFWRKISSFINVQMADISKYDRDPSIWRDLSWKTQTCSCVWKAICLKANFLCTSILAQSYRLQLCNWTFTVVRLFIVYCILSTTIRHFHSKI